MRCLFSGLMILLMLSILAGPALAQEQPEEVLPIPSVDTAARLLLATLLSIFGAMMDSPLTTFLVSLLKRVPFLTFISAKGLQFAVAAIIGVVYWILTAIGLGDQMNTALKFILAILPALNGLFTRQIASSLWYHASLAANVGVVSYKRPDRYHQRRAAA